MIDEIAPANLATLLDSDGDIRVIDIRSPAAFERGHIPDSENVPFPELPRRVEEFADADRVVTVCPHGKDSLRAARLVNSYEGTTADVESLAGGLSAWEGELVGPAERDVPGDGPDAPF